MCARNKLFDNKIVAMTFTIAHIVIINNKGEITSTLRSLIELCIYALKVMNLSKSRTKLIFALRDHSDNNQETQ